MPDTPQLCGRVIEAGPAGGCKTLDGGGCTFSVVVLWVQPEVAQHLARHIDGEVLLHPLGLPGAWPGDASARRSSTPRSSSTTPASRRSSHRISTRPRAEAENQMGLPLVFDTFNLQHNEREACTAALVEGGNIAEASKLLGITRHALKRRIVKHRINWPRQPEQA